MICKRRSEKSGEVILAGFFCSEGEFDSVSIDWSGRNLAKTIVKDSGSPSDSPPFTWTNSVGELQIGVMDHAIGTFNMAGGSLLVTNNNVGNIYALGSGSGAGTVGGSGTFNMSDGMFTVWRSSGTDHQDGFIVGWGTNSTGIFTIAGGTASAICGVETGVRGMGTLTVNGGVLVDNGWFGLGRGGPTTAPFTGSGTFNLSAGTVYLLRNSSTEGQTDGIEMGQNGTNAVLNISGGALYCQRIGMGPNTGNQSGTKLEMNISGGNIYLGDQGIVSNTVAAGGNPESVNISGWTFHTAFMTIISSTVNAGDISTVTNYLGIGTNWTWTVNPSVNLTNNSFLVNGVSGPGYVTFAPEATRIITLNNQWSGVGGLTVNGPGTLALGAANTFSGNTTIKQGTLALAGTGSISNSPHIIMSSGTAFDVSGASSTFTLAPGQFLSNNGSTATIIGSVNTGAGTMSLTYDGSTPSLAVASGTLTLDSGTTFRINISGAALGPGIYKFISSTGRLCGGNFAAVHDRRRHYRRRGCVIHQRR